MIFVPTYLYIKQHAITGKCYFGKTTCKDPIKYLGSGLYWVPHIKKHGIEHVVTLWYELFINQEELTKFALEFSEKMGIVKSERWLNLKPENGLDGGWETVNLLRSPEEFLRICKLGGIAGSAKIKDKIKSNPIYTEKWKNLGKNVGNIHATKMKNDPIYAKIHIESTLEGRRLGGANFSKRLKSDRQLAEQYRNMGMKNGKKCAGKKWKNGKKCAGKKWIYLKSEQKTKMVFLNEIKSYSDLGWKQGRKLIGFNHETH